MDNRFISDIQKERLEREKKERERELSDIRKIVQLPEGRRFYWRVMEAGGVFNDAYSGESTNQTNYNLGKQEVSRKFLNDLLEAKPDALMQMQNERKAEEKDKERQDETLRKNNGGLI